MTRLRDALGLAAPRRGGRPPLLTRRDPVAWSNDLGRVVALPQRELTYSPAEVAALEAELRAPAGPCVCAAQGRDCPLHLREMQAYALLEARATAGRCVLSLGAGHGKELACAMLPMVVPDCRVAVLLIQANLQAQFFQRDWPYYSAHWRLPNLVGGRTIVPGRPTLHVITYQKLQHPNSTTILRQLNPDLVVANEAQNLKAVNGPRVTRFRQFVESRQPRPRLVPATGTPMSKALMDCFHLWGFALDDGSPYPLSRGTAEEWNGAIGPCECDAAKDETGETPCCCRAPAGALAAFSGGNADIAAVREGFRKFRNATPGVVASSETAVGIPLIFRRFEVPLPGVPEHLEHVAEERRHLTLEQHIAAARNPQKGVRPDGEELVDPLARAEAATALGAGLFHRWRYPRQEPPAVIARWFARRQDYNREVRAKLQHPRPHLDSPALLMRAAERAEAGYVGELPVWHSETWGPWLEVMDTVQPVPQVCRISNFLAQAGADWAKAHAGIVWVDYPELGRRIAALAGLPYYGEGADEAALYAETGERSVVLSTCHRTGKNLQQWHRNLVLAAIASAEMWEQLLARTHRPGQRADEVEVAVALHTEQYRAAFSQARERARFLDQSDGPQRLHRANFEWV